MNSKLIAGAAFMCSSVNAFDLSSLMSFSEDPELELTELNKPDPDFSKTF
jgi:hypothetical protein